MKKVGVIGCGAMGRGMVKNLIQHGYKVYVYDVDPLGVESAVSYGALAGHSVPSVAEGVEVLLTSLPTPSILEETILGGSGALHVMGKGSLILDMGTTDVETTRKLHKVAAMNDVGFYDCPVSGGPQGADQGTLTIMVGGDRERFDQVDSVLQAIGQEILYIGESGSGQVVKLCNNMVVAGINLLLSEAFLTGVKAGVSVDRIANVMEKGSGQSKVLSVFGPNLIQGSYDNVIFLLSHMAKDVDLYRQLARQGGIPSFMSSVISQLYELAKVQGKGGMDTTAVGQLLEELAKQKIVSRNE
ncbi:NAD(P)-dependent oxidoreductase [Ammoniphilus sp. CFH 90114]|uniref:NAD(P)-dependent oxidoreductase n=1 Tax=Ammoniphilus sp. CFH 90114 TaxID=2493665 RepID=UPI00100FC7DF|nr:NAD(P)-dependent oxidoreductase [Ammoniphilus sp. CFH 90114]RXT04572.1 NAD(P)-dependent oxidoreductase [Ammoniphilus sp. CFH 90114]